jgi:hypothetical protein
MFDELDPLLHSQLRLAVMSLLIGVEEAEFNFLKDKTGATAGNLSVQVHKLADADYLSIEKSFRNNFPLTICRITPLGIAAFERYVDTLKQYIDRK